MIEGSRGLKRLGFSLDGRTLASTTLGDTQLWDTNTGALRHELSSTLYKVRAGPESSGACQAE